MPPIGTHGTIVKRAPAATPGVFTTIASLLDITPPRGTRNVFENTPQTSDDDENVVGYKHWSTMTMKMNFIKDDPTQDPATGLKKSFDDGDLDEWQLIYPDGEGEQFFGRIVGWGPDGAPVEGALTGTVEVKSSGAFTDL